MASAVFLLLIWTIFWAVLNQCAPARSSYKPRGASGLILHLLACSFAFINLNSSSSRSTELQNQAPLDPCSGKKKQEKQKCKFAGTSLNNGLTPRNYSQRSTILNALTNKEIIRTIPMMKKLAVRDFP